MKSTSSLAVSLAILIILVGCNDETEIPLPTLDVRGTAIDNGAALQVRWYLDGGPEASADGYYIYADGAVIDTINDPSITTYDATIPAAVYGVSCYKGHIEGLTYNLDCRPVETANILVYGNSDPNPNHHSGIRFTRDGNCVTLDINDPANHPYIDFYFDDVFFSMMAIVSPNMQPNPYNSEKNQTAASGTDYDGLDIAADLTDYAIARELFEGDVLSFWIDTNDNYWDTQDHFGKMKIHSVHWAWPEPDTAVITVAYQRIYGLRWVITD